MYDYHTVLAVAQREIGYLEKKSEKDLDSKTDNAGYGNYTKYWRDIKPSYQGNQWCDCFVSWCFYTAYGPEAANKLLCGGLYSFYTPDSSNLFKKNKRWSDKPEPGAVVYFKNSVRIHHTGLVKRVSGNLFTTIEGNTSAGSGVVANGGGVAEKTYSVSDSAVAGFGIPEYGTATIPSAEYPMWIKSDGIWYYRVQEGQNAHGWRDINGHRYWFDEKGRMATEWKEINGQWYYFQPESGKAASLAGALYVSDETGAQRILTVK